MNVVEVQKLNKAYPGFALKDVSFSIPRGYVTGFIGKNGMGKTTTIKAMLSLSHYSGDILFNHLTRDAGGINQKIGVVMDDSFLAKDWNMDLVNKAMRLGYDAWDEALFWSYLEQYHIDRRLKVKELSRGMKIKLMLAIALSHKAELLILDEPTSGLDPSMREEFLELLSAYMQEENHTVLFSTHITQDLEAIADYIVFIDRGEIVLSLEKSEFLDYFVICKCDLERQNLIKDSAVLGKKMHKYYVEYLLKRSALEDMPEGYLEEKVSIDRIMILYGRNVSWAQ